MFDPAFAIFTIEEPFECNTEEKTIRSLPATVFRYRQMRYSMICCLITASYHPFWSFSWTKAAMGDRQTPRSDGKDIPWHSRIHLIPQSRCLPGQYWKSEKIHTTAWELHSMWSHAVCRWMPQLQTRCRILLASTLLYCALLYRQKTGDELNFPDTWVNSEWREQTIQTHPCYALSLCGTGQQSQAMCVAMWSVWFPSYYPPKYATNFLLVHAWVRVRARLRIAWTLLSLFSCAVQSAEHTV